MTDTDITQSTCSQLNKYSTTPAGSTNRPGYYTVTALYIAIVL